MDDAGGTTGLAAPAAGDGEAAPAPRDRLLTRIGVVTGLLAIVLLVFGGLRLWSASDDNAAADRAWAHAHQLRRAEQAATRVRSAITGATSDLARQVASGSSLSRQLGDAQNAITDAFNRAVGLGNNGDVNGAEAGFRAQAGAVADLDAKLGATRQALAQAQQRLADLQTAERGP